MTYGMRAGAVGHGARYKAVAPAVACSIRTWAPAEEKRIVAATVDSASCSQKAMSDTYCFQPALERMVTCGAGCCGRRCREGRDWKGKRPLGLGGKRLHLFVRMHVQGRRI